MSFCYTFRKANTYRLVEEHGGQEVVHHFADLGVLLDVGLVRDDQLLFADGEVGEDLVVELDVFVFHWIAYKRL